MGIGHAFSYINGHRSGVQWHYMEIGMFTIALIVGSKFTVIFMDIWTVTKMELSFIVAYMLYVKWNMLNKLVSIYNYLQYKV